MPSHRLETRGAISSNALSGKPLISVIMPCYNAGAHLTEAVDSAMGQTYGDIELLLIDDGSSDESPAIAAGLAHRYGARLVRLQTNRVGPYPARNVGLRMAQGELVAFLDADDWWKPCALEELYAALVACSSDIAYCGWQNVGSGLQSEPYVPPAYETEDTVAHFLRTCPWPIHAALMRRAVVDQLGGFSEKSFSSMDYDFWLRALAVTRRLVRVPEVLAYYRWHGAGQVSAVKWRQVLDALNAQKQFISANPTLVAHLPPARLKELTEGQVMRQAYRAFWKRDLVSAQKLFRHAAKEGAFRAADVRHIMAALLPMPAYRWLVDLGGKEEG